jgi:hypothetical protein
MHSRDPDKDNAKFQAEFERILKEAGTGTADLSYFVFPSANYGMREFTAQCSFAWARFAGDALFYQAKFGQRADFTGAVFTRDSSFWQATFTQDAEFGGSKFAKGAEFTETTFIGNARFSGASFGGPATFWKARFMREALFGGADFTEDAEFRDASISEDAIFNEATFGGQAGFRRTAFMGVAAFIRATFTADADFTWATFAQRAEFRFAAFEGQAIFRETRFREDNTLSPGPIFSNARFDKPTAVTFFRTFLGQAIFRNCDMSMFVFSDVRWRERSNNGKRMLFEEVADPGDEALGAIPAQGRGPDERNYRLISELYQQLKKNYDDRRDYWTAGDFHYGEMEMKRLACPRLTWLSQLEAKLSGRPRLRKLGEWCGKLRCSPWLLSELRSWHQRLGLAAWYRRASDYGESWGKPLLWLSAVIVLFAALYPLLGLRPAEGRSPAAKTTPIQVQTASLQETSLRYWNCERPGRLFRDSVMTSLSVAAFQRDLAYEPGYPWGRLLALVELLLTSTLIALILLAVRRQFRR